jgi:hypothetical protein
MWITPLTPGNAWRRLPRNGSNSWWDEEDLMDATTLLTLAVAVTIVSSGYYLFFGVPQLKARRPDRSQRPPRR